MNVSELRAELSKHPDDMEVMFNDCEMGPCDISTATVELYPPWLEPVKSIMKKAGLEPAEVLVLG